MRTSNERGNATIEFLGFLLMLVIPSIVGITALGSVLSAQEAGVSAAREVSRVFVRAQNYEEGYLAAQESINRVLGYKGLLAERPSEISCTDSVCFAPGSDVTVTVYVHIDVPFIGGGVSLKASETMPVDELRASRQ
ncbi:MAG: hypothetical protein IKZ87_06020 [Actinomycetaceae bacterium]|nr:hypothetical protein [Actinomycetaceae bacterium]